MSLRLYALKLIPTISIRVVDYDRDRMIRLCEYNWGNCLKFNDVRIIGRFCERNHNPVEQFEGQMYENRV